MNERLLVAIDNGDLTWSDVDGATLRVLNEKIEGNKYHVSLGVDIGDERYLWNLTGNVKNGD